MRSALLSVFYIPFILFSCTGSNSVAPKEDSWDESGGRYSQEYDSYTTVPISAKVTKVQPMTGIVTWSDSGYKNKDWLTLEFAYMLYNDVCKEQDVFDWTPMEQLLDAIASRGHQAVVRFRYTYVGKSCAVPDYIKNWPGYEETRGKSEGRTTYFPDWRCEELQRFHMEFHKRFAEKYDNDPRLAFLETGFGLWAEYHIYDGPMVLGKTFPSKDFQAKFISSMDDWFKKTPWMISIDAADIDAKEESYTPFQEKPELLNNMFGNFDDSFMCEDHDGYNYESCAFFGTDRYTTAPFGGEFSYYTSSDQKHCLDKAGMHGRKFEDEVAKYHMTFIIGADQPEYQSDSRLKEAGMSMGYRFQVNDFRIKEGVGAVVNIANVGVAPIYRDAYVAVDGKRSSFSLKNLMPGENSWEKIDLPEVSEKSVITIECDHLVSGQKIQFQAGQ